mmetsp:Transcript_82370/g.143139  ORF Transcript_82370/g.143139 Transcript_82370/m.143139 type:complete len:172 (+) Transcript_82370:2293-2808(+)
MRSMLCSTCRLEHASASAPRRDLRPLPSTEVEEVLSRLGQSNPHAAPGVYGVPSAALAARRRHPAHDAALLGGVSPVTQELTAAHRRAAGALLASARQGWPPPLAAREHRGPESPAKRRSAQAAYDVAGCGWMAALPPSVLAGGGALEKERADATASGSALLEARSAAEKG